MTYSLKHEEKRGNNNDDDDDGDDDDGDGDGDGDGCEISFPSIDSRLKQAFVFFPAP